MLELITGGAKKLPVVVSHGFMTKALCGLMINRHSS